MVEPRGELAGLHFRDVATAGARVVLADLQGQEDKGTELAKEIGGIFAPTE